MRNSMMTIVAALAAFSAGCPGESTDYNESVEPVRSTPDSDAGPLGTCRIVCRGQTAGCRLTTESECRPAGSLRVPNCLAEPEWSPPTMCTGYTLGGPVDEAIDACAPAACAKLSDEEAETQKAYAQACKAVDGDVTQCNCGLVACSVDPTP